MNHQTATNHEEQEQQVLVKILFKATKHGFGPYEIADQESTQRRRRNAAAERRNAAADANRRRSHLGSGGNSASVGNDPKRQSLTDDQDLYVTDVGSFPQQLKGLISEEEYAEKMTKLISVMSFSSGHTIPLATFATFTVVGICLDVLVWEWIGFFMVVLPLFGFFVSYHVINKAFKADVEGVFQDWRPDIKGCFKPNVMKGNFAEVELRAVSPPQPTNNTLSAGGVQV